MKKRNIYLIHFLAIIAFILFFTGLSQAITITSPSSAIAGQNVTVTIQASFVFSMAPTCGIDVDFGDGSPVVHAATQGGCPYSPSTCSRTVSHIYTASSIYMITARHVIGGCVSPSSPDPAIATITINPPPPLTITANPNPSTVGQNVNIAVTGTVASTPCNVIFADGTRTLRNFSWTMTYGRRSFSTLRWHTKGNRLNAGTCCDH